MTHKRYRDSWRRLIRLCKIMGWSTDPNKEPFIRVYLNQRKPCSCAICSRPKKGNSVSKQCRGKQEWRDWKGFDEIDNMDTES